MRRNRSGPYKVGGKRKRLARPAGQGPVKAVSDSGGTEMANAAIRASKKKRGSKKMAPPEKGKKPEKITSSKGYQ